MRERIVVGTFTPSVLLEVARRTGRLAAHELEIAEVAVQSSPAQFRSLLDGELDLALTSPDNVLTYRYNPANPLGELADVAIVAAVDRGMGLGLYARPGLDAAGLAGAVIGVDVPNSGFALALYALTERLGLTPDAYSLAALGSTPRRLEALLAGDCDATMLNAGNELIAADRGFRRLTGAREQLAPYLGTVLTVVGDRRLGAARRLAAALHETTTALLDGGLSGETVAAAQDRLGLDTRLAGQYLDVLRDPVDGLVADGAVDRSTLENLVRLRMRHLPAIVDGVDVLERALDPATGLLRG